MKTQIAFYQAGSEVVRYHTIHTLQRETVGHHSHGVALLACLIAEEPSLNLVFAALVHDLAEHETGDIPSPAKRAYGIGEEVTALEERLLEESGWAPEDLTPKEQRTLKLADIAQGALFCVREIGLGNSKLRVVLDRYLSYAEAMNPVGVERELFDIIKESA